MHSSYIETQVSESIFSDDSRTELFAIGKDFEYNTCSNDFEFHLSLPSGLLILNPRPSDQEMNVIYPAHYGPYRFNELPFLIKKARDFVQKGKIKVFNKYVPADGRILDLGCGNGTLLKLAKEFGNKSWELHANDLNQDIMSRLEKEGFKVHAKPAEEIHLNNYFDAIILNQVIEHFSNVNKLMETCHRLLKTNGVLIIETPSTEGLDAKIFKKRYWGGYHFPRHFYLFNELLLRRLGESYKFNVLEVNYLASPAFWVQSFHHYFLDKKISFLTKFFKIENIFVVTLFTAFDIFRSLLGFKTSNIQVILRKQ